MEESNEGKPSNFIKVAHARERELPQEYLAITSQDLPWADKKFFDKKTGTKKIPLAYIVTKEGFKFYFGSALLNDDLIGAANQLDSQGPKGSQIANKVFYSHLPEFLRGSLWVADTLKNGITEKPIYYIGNKQGKRIYFMRFKNKDGLDIILRIAACDKDRQQQVLGVITSANHRHIKQSGGL